MFPISRSNLNERSEDSSYEVNLPALFKLFTKEINEQDEMKPSTYQKEVSLIFNERLKQLKSVSKYDSYFNTLHGGDFFDCFDVDPSILVFQNWEVDKQYMTTIMIINKTKKVKFISVSVEESEIFLITPKQVRKISGHGSVIYKVKFLPVHYIDYKIKIIINSDDSFYNFEIIALHPMPIINFPDNIDFGKILINFNSMKSVHLTNIGCGKGMAKIYTNCKDILIEPEYICLNVNDVVNLDIKFHPSVLGHVKEKIIIAYSTGEKLFIEIQAIIIKGNIFFNDNELVFKETFITFNEFSSLTINNNTENPIKFQWLGSEKDEGERRKSRSILFGSQCDKLCELSSSSMYDLCDRSSHDSLVQGEFSITPMEGVLPMNNSFTFMVMFSPISVGKAKSVFYLDVEGLEKKLSVNISGIALGPAIHLSLSTLDIHNIYVNEKYDYQLFAKNSSLVQGTIRLLPLSVFNKLIEVTVDLEEAVLNPKDIILINVSITSGVLGSFVVELRFEIIESKNIIKCIIKGTVIEPVIKVEESCIDFGTVPIGVRFDKCFTIVNHSSIDVTFKLQIPLDCVEDAKMHHEFIKDFIIGLSERPNEFHLEPKDVMIPGKSKAEIKVSLVANLAKKYEGNILISSELHLYEEKKLPVTFIAVAPEITCFPNSLFLPYCFKGIEYEQEISLSNKENVQATFWVLDYMDEVNKVHCHGKKNEMGLIGPSQSIEFTLKLSIGTIEEHSFTVLAYVLGNGIIPLCDITIKGMGPVILVETSSLVWHNTEILNPTKKTFTIINNSPIPAEFIISPENEPKLWIISTYEGTIEPNERINIIVAPNPIDTGLYKDRLLINVKESRTSIIKLEAFATGTSIRFSPNIFPSIDFGIALRIADNKKKILVSNIGSKAQLVILSINNTPSFKNIRTHGNLQGKHFRIYPCTFVLPEYSEMFLRVNLKSQSLGHKEEIIYCFTRLECKYKMTYLNSSVMRANFVDLNLTYDPSVLRFEIVSSIHQDPQPIKRPFTVHIDWERPVKLVMTVPEPFGLFKNNNVIHEDIFMISNDHPLKTVIYFDPMYVKDYRRRSYSRVLSFFVVDYNYKKSCTISADVYFPNISLNCSSINFECVELLHSCQKEIKLRNSSPTPTSYRWYWISVLPLLLDKDSLQKPSSKTSHSSSFEKKNLCEQTRGSLMAFKYIENNRFSSFQEFEREATNCGLDFHPLVAETGTHDENKEKRTSMDCQYASFLEFSPFSGELEGGGCSVTIIEFSPRYYLCFEAIAVCVVEGGPSEKLIIQGCCSPINFEIIPDVISLGFAPCCELSKSILIIKNNCLKTLPFKVYAPKWSHKGDLILDKVTLDESSIWVDENIGVVNPFSSIQLVITLWFGTIGEVDINLTLEVNNKAKIIKILAYCCPNQVMISLPRKFPQLMEEYLVLASLREPWFFIPDLITEIEDDWEIIILPKMFPSPEDVCMGMERFFLHLALYHHPSLFSEHFLAEKRTFTIKDFKVPSYFIDFGVVMLGTKAEYKVQILNYYPREIILRVRWKNFNELAGLEFQDLRSCFVLAPLGTAEFSVSVFATNMFEKSDINISYAFDIEVICGPTIPILLSATISFPRMLLPDSIDFGFIQCNQMKIINIPIKNIGIISCEWVVFVRDLQCHHHESNKLKSNIKIPFIVKKPYGFTEPNVSDHIPIYFKPIKSGEYNMILEFVINMNPEKITIPIKGVGLGPLIVLPDIDFGCVIPYCKPIIKTLEIINLSSFPVEVFFPVFDDEIMAEASVFQAITRYYKQDIYVLSTDEETIPYNTIFNIYRRICDEAIMFEKFSRLYNLNEYNQIPSFGSFGVKKSRSELVFKKRFQLDLRRCTSLPNIGKSETKSSFLISRCHRKSPEQLLKEYFDYLDCGYRPIPEYLNLKKGNIHCSKPTPFASKEITLIIVLGAPETDHIEWAAKLAKEMGMISISLDEIIFQELGESDSVIAEETRTSIRELYIKEIVKDDCFDDQNKYPCTNYVEVKSMVEELMSECSFKLFQFYIARMKIGGTEYSQPLPFRLTAESLKQLISRKISKYSNNVLIENIEGFFFSDVTIALSVLVELFADNTNFNIINLHSFPIWYLKFIRTLVESEADNNFKAIVEYMTYLHGIEHAEILADIPSFVRRYYYLFSIGDIDGESCYERIEDVLSNRPQTVRKNQEQNEETIAVFSSKSLISLENSSPFEQVIQESCYDIIKSEDLEIIWTRSFVSPLKLHSLLKEFMKYACWFSSLIPLWSAMRRSRLKSLKKNKKHPNDLYVIRDRRLSKRYSRCSTSFKRSRRQTLSNQDRSFSFDSKIRKNSNDFVRTTNRRPTKISFRFSFWDRMRSLKSSMDIDFITQSKATKVINYYPDLPLWILCTEDLNFEKLIPLLCSQKTAFGIKLSPDTEEKDQNFITEPRIYFHLNNSKTIDNYQKLTNFNICKEIDETKLVEIHNHIAIKKQLSERFHKGILKFSGLYEQSQELSRSCEQIPELCRSYEKSIKYNSSYDRIKEFNISYEMKPFSQYNNLLFSQKSLGKLSDLNFTARKILEPGEKASWKICYSPVSCALVSNMLTVLVAGFDNRFTTHIEGICDIPSVAFEFSDLLLNVPFSSDISSYHKIGFCVEESTYYFQPVLISRVKKPTDIIQHQEAYFTVTNTSSVTAKVFINFSENSNEFAVQPEKVEIEPNEAVVIKIISSITCVGSFMEKIILSTENNPLPQTIQVFSEGILPQIKIEPKYLRFKHTLLYQEKNSAFRITNLCYKSIYWEITSLDILAPVIKCSKMSGIIEPNSSEDIFVSYRPEKCYDHKKFLVQIYDSQNLALLKCKLYTLFLYATDVKVEINTNFKRQNYLDFGNIKVLNKYVSEVEVKLSESCAIEVFYRACIATHKKVQGYYISDYITIDSKSEGCIYNNNVVLPVVVFCKNEVHFEKVEAISVEIYSPFDSDLQIAAIPLIFSFQSHFPKCTLYPGNYLDFGDVEIDAEKKLFLTLENTGVIDFNYSFEDLKYNSNRSFVHRKSFSFKRETIMESSSSIIYLPPLKISKKTGNILPGKKEIYEVVCKPKTVEKMFYEILLKIPELPEKPQIISICYAGIAPALNFDLESLFRELNVVNTRQELSDFTNNGYFVAVFIKTEHMLCFKNVSLYQTVSVDVFIENKSHLCCDVSVNVNGEGFSIKPPTLYIESYLKEIVTLTYSPRRFGVHQGNVEIKLNLPYITENSSFTFLIEGNSELPSISIYDYFSRKLINNNPIRIGFTANTTPVRHLLRIQNSGNLFSETIIDVESATNVTVTLGLVSIQNMIGPEAGYDTKSVRFYLHPKETAVMGFTLTPEKISTYTAILVAYTVLNPYERHKVIITGEAITMDILLDGLILNNYFPEHSSHGSSREFTNYNMNFGLCESGMVKKIIFYISNPSTHLWVFKFSSLEFVSFTPCIGYVSPHNRVKIESILDTNEQSSTDLKKNKRGILFLAKVTVIDELRSSEPSILWQTNEKKVKSNETEHNVINNEVVQDVETDTIIVNKINNRIFLIYKYWPVETTLSLYRDEQSKFQSTVVKQCSEEILFLKNTSEASCHVIFQLQDISFKEIDCELEFLDRIGFVKIPTHSILSDDPFDELLFFDMNHVFPDVSLNDVFSPLFVQEMLLPESTIKAKFTFCPPKPGVYSANVRIIMDDVLLNYPQTPLSLTSYVPPIQIMLKNEVDKNEFQLLGILSSVKCIKITAYEPKCFIRNKLIYVYNASDSTFSYNWYNKHNVSTIENSSTGFYCHQAYGNLEKQSVLKLEMLFNPQDYGVYESLWHLEIPDYNTEQAFLFIGETKIPDIIFEPEILTLDPVFIDMKFKYKIMIHNKEKVLFKYKVDDISLFSDIDSEKLSIDPSSGILEPNTTHEVSISSTLHVVRKYVYKTFWSFENVAKRWCFKVITECLSVEVGVCCINEGKNTKETILLKETESNFINIGKVAVNDILTLNFVISNKGKVAIKYKWVFPENIIDKLGIEINPYEKFVPAFTDFSTLMKITVIGKLNFRNIPFILKVFKGPVYTVFFCGSSEDPLYRLSFKKHDFGTQLIQTTDNVYNKVNLQFKNLDEEMMEIKLKFPVVDHFKIQLPCLAVAPKSGIDIPIHFFPRDKRKYNETVEIFINNTYNDAIVLLGEGELFQVLVVKPLKGIIVLDQIDVNKLITEETEVINQSNTIFNISLKIKNEYEELIEIKLDPSDIELRPNLLFKISVFVRCFSLGDYSGIEVWAICREFETRLYSLTIHCTGAKLAFDRETVNFFPHYRKQLHTEEVAIINSGNIPARFKLDVTDLPEIFKIEPLEGECLPGIPYILNILCFLKFITNYLSAKVKCIVEGKNDHLVLTLITYPFLSGVELQTLEFLCPVRQQYTQTISVENGTNKTLSLKPLITGQYFTGKLTLEVPPKSVETYAVLYEPLTMTKDVQTHKGILVIPTQPKEMVVKLEGRSTEPLLDGTVKTVAIAREQCEIKFNVENPLKTLQKMNVRFIKSPSNKNIFNIEGKECILLPGKGTKEYIVNFYAYKEGTANFDVIFTNDETFEFMFYNIIVEILPPIKTWETVEMNTIVDHSINKIISIYNPLEINDEFTVSSDVLNIDNELNVEPFVLDIHPKTYGEFSIIYSPKKEEKREVELEVTGNLLGSYFYRIILSSGAPLFSNIISLSVPFGSKLNFILKLPKPIVKEVSPLVQNESKKKTYIVQQKVATICHTLKISTVIFIVKHNMKRKVVREVLIFRAKSDNPELTIKSLDDSSRIEELSCAFEPTSIGTRNALVTVEYFTPYKLFTYKVVCQCEPPQPQGPFDISVFEPFIIRFKNLSNTKQTYSCSCVYDECWLTISKPKFILEAEEVIKIEINVRDEDELNEHSAIVRITDLPNQVHKWDYYFNLHR